MTRTPYTLADVGASLPWDALVSFIRHLPSLSETCAELYPEKAQRAWWLANAPALELADLYDLMAKAHSKKGARPKRYPRPFDDKEKQGYGKDPIPVSQFDDWWDHGQEDPAG